MGEKISIADYLLRRLEEMGIAHLFGVPGDYNLLFLDRVVACKGIDWVGTCNELNGAYASDGYARVRGAGALLTTFGVGELSAINGVAGAFAEYCPVVHIVGMPSLAQQEQKALLHHTLGEGDFEVFAKMFSHVTAAQTVVRSKERAAQEIDRVLTVCWQKKRPVYIGLPLDMHGVLIDAPEAPLTLSSPPSPQDALQEVVEALAAMIRKAKNPVLLADICAVRHGIKNEIEAFLKGTGIPFATMNMAKGIIDESHPQFLGDYCGAFGTKDVQKRVESADCILTCGTILSDFNTGGFTTRIDINVAAQLHSTHVKIKRALYQNIHMRDVLSALKEALKDYSYRGDPIVRPVKEPSKGEKLTQEVFWKEMEQALPPNSTLVAETGTSLFGCAGLRLPDNTRIIAQPLWASIGYSVGALLGACMAAPDQKMFLFVGDGSFQLTAQEISTLMRHNLCPTVFLLNNDGYTIERVIHGETMVYNDIAMWKYADLPRIFGNNVETMQVKTLTDLKQVLKDLDKLPKRLRFVEVFLPKMDSPVMMQNIIRSQKMGKA